jgi:hypothetical protein
MVSFGTHFFVNEKKRLTIQELFQKWKKVVLNSLRGWTPGSFGQ